MSNLYKEALIDGRKLRKVAEEEAKKKLLEKFTPYVKEMISKEFKDVSLFSENAAEAAFVVGEQEEQDPAAMPADPTTTAAPSTDPASMAAPATPDVVAEPAIANSNPPAEPSAELPVEPVGGSNDLGSTTLDAVSDDGKIVVDVNDLFSPSAPEAVAQAEIEATSVEPVSTEPGMEQPSGNDASEAPIATDAEMAGQTPAVPAPEEQELAPAPEEPAAPVVETVEKIVSGINEMALKIDLLSLKEVRVKDIEKNYHKTRLFSLLEQVDNLKENGLITGKQATILENKLEFLFIKLKEANLTNSYMKTTSIKENNTGDNKNMATKSLQSIAAKLFLEETDAMEKTQSAADSRSKANSAHAKSASGNPKNVKAESEDSVPTKEKEVAWDEQDPNGQGVLEENAEVGDETVKASAGFGDTSEDPEVEFEVSEAELMEAIKQLRKESISKKVKALKEQAELGECGDDGMMEEDFGAAEEDLDADVDVGGDLDVDSAEADLQAAFDALGLSDVDVDLDMAGAGSDDEEIEIVDDEGDLGSEEEGALLHDDEGAGEEEDLAAEMALYEAAQRKKKAAIAKLREGAVAKKRLLEMKKELHENNLFTAKTVFLNKILMREKDMSKDTTRKVVELLDKARTLSEAKEIYQKILVRLQESKQVAQRKVSGQSRQQASASTTATLKEGKVGTQQQQEVLQEGALSVARWQQIAGIKQK